MKVFISGPMTGIEKYNRPSFNAAARKLKKAGHIVLNPAMLPDGMQHHEYMKVCFAMVDIADAIYQLPGWEKSKGARMEHERAAMLRLGHIVFSEVTR